MVRSAYDMTSSRRCLGPVADLESHLPDDWWRTLFNAIYVKTDGDVVENDDNTRSDVDFIETAAALRPDSQILDMCCGQGRHVLELARRGYSKITGLDRSRYLIRLARRRAKAEGLTAVFREGDSRTPRLPTASFDCVTILGNSFGYFSSSNEDRRVLDAAARLLKSSGTIMLDLADGNWLAHHFEPRSWEWIDSHHFVCRERSLANDGERLISREVVTHDEMGVIADQFYAERLYTADSITNLLHDAGFRNIRHHGNVSTKSDRNQDLGMMAHRMILTATAPLQKSRPKRGSRGNLSVTVILGDPRLPDSVKRNGQFNIEDHETVAALKASLEAVPGYDIRYLDNHATLERDLDAQSTDLVFNLCDEGFNNDAFKELHVPAMLEVRDVPYTGAAPQCLALCYDKGLTRAIAVQLDIPVPFESYVRPSDQGATLPAVFPALLKPNFGDSSEGITQDAVVHDNNAFVSYLDKLHVQFPDRPVLVQEFLEGPEYSVAVIGNIGHGPRALPLLEVDYSGLAPDLPKILGYESKWLPDSPYWSNIRYKEASLDDHDEARLVDYSMRLFERLGCRDYARFDFRTDRNGTIKLLEVNPNPGWCWDGKLNIMAGFEGMSYSEMIAAILNAAVMRHNLSTRSTALERRLILERV